MGEVFLQDLEDDEIPSNVVFEDDINPLKGQPAELVGMDYDEMMRLAGEDEVKRLKSVQESALQKLQSDALQTGLEYGVPAALGMGAGTLARGVVGATGVIPSIAESLATTAGQAVGNVITQGTESLDQYTKINPLKEPLEFIKNPAVQDLAITAVTKGAGKLLGGRKPSETISLREAAKKKGSLAGSLNLLETPAGSNPAKAKQLIELEDSFQKTGVIDDAVRNSPDPYSTLSKNIEDGLSERIIRRDKLLSGVDEIRKETISLSGDDLETFTKKNIEAKRASGVDRYVSDSGIAQAREELAKQGVYSTSATDLQKRISLLDDEISSSGGYQASIENAKMRGDGKLASKLEQELISKEYQRDYFANKLEEVAPEVSQLNKELQALTVYKDPVQQAKSSFSKEFSGRSQIRDLDTPFAGMTRFLDDALSGGTAGREARRLRGVSGLDKQTMSRAAAIMDMKQGNFKPSFADRFQGAVSRPSVTIPVTRAAGSGLASVLAPQEAQAEILGLPMQPQDPYANGLPRESSRFGQDAVIRLAADIEQTIGVDPQAEVKLTLLKGIGMEFAKASRVGDEGKKQKLIADMAKMAPEFFEPGRGIDNRLFHEEDKQSYMEELKRLQRSGKVGASFLAKQQDIFYDKNDGRILDLEEPLSKRMLPKGGQPITPAGIFPNPKQYDY